MKEVIQKLTTYLLIIILAFHVALPVVVLADTTPTDTPTPVPTSTDTATPTPAATSTDTPTPTNAPTITPSPTDTPTPTPDPSSATATVTPSETPAPDPTGIDTASKSATNQNNITTSNTSPATSSGSSCTNCASSTTGNTNATTQGENDVNTTSINSTAVNQTINIFLPQDGNLDLSDPSKIAADVVSTSTQNGEIFNISIVNNNAYVDTNVISIANTGNNTASGSGEFAINTGNATSLVQLVNKINVTLVNSQIHFITINIYGTLNGNIILPEPSPTPQNCTPCGVTQTTTGTNQTTVTNTIGSTANSGNNTVTTTSGGSITTGSANAITNIINLINEVVFGISFDYLIINDMGTWNGNFVGWGNISGTTGNGNLQLTSTTPTSNNSSSTQSTAVSNNAIVSNTISSTANSGNNTSTSNGHGIILTGNAASIVSLINLINTAFINSKTFFAFINIFGTLNGDIGGSDHFPTPTPTTKATSSSGPATKEDGGELSVVNTNNTGAYVLPGDTVTFFITVNNPGKGKTYDTHVHLAILKNGIEEGGTDYNLGDIDAGHMIKLTTGLVLSTKTPGGMYTAHAYATGTTGNSNTSVQAYADSTFSVFVPQVAAVNSFSQKNPILPEKDILAAHTPNLTQNDRTYTVLILILLSLVLSYIIIRLIQGKDQLLLAFSRNQNLKNRLNALKLFLM